MCLIKVIAEQDDRLNMNLHCCDSLFGLLLFGIWLIIDAEDGKPRAKRFADKPFPMHNIIYDRNVTCGELPEERGKFVSLTWTCRDIRVNNNKLAYGYYPGIGVDSKCGDTGGKHEFAQLCRELLKKVAAPKELYALYIPEASCDYTNQSRALLNQTANATFAWTDHGAGHGWINTIQCMVLPTKT